MTDYYNPKCATTESDIPFVMTLKILMASYVCKVCHKMGFETK